MMVHILAGKRTMNNAMMRAHNACRDVLGVIVYRLVVKSNCPFYDYDEIAKTLSLSYLS